VFKYYSSDDGKAEDALGIINYKDMRKSLSRDLNGELSKPTNKVI
jgi:hypothetical protein